MVNDRMRSGQAMAQEQLRVRRAESQLLKEQTKSYNFKKKQESKVQSKEHSKIHKFASKVESQNVRGIIPPVENRGMHNMVTFNPFSSPEKELERDPRTGLLRVKNSVWG